MNPLNDPREPRTRGPAAYILFLASIIFFCMAGGFCVGVVTGWL